MRRADRVRAQRKAAALCAQHFAVIRQRSLECALPGTVTTHWTNLKCYGCGVHVKNTPIHLARRQESRDVQPVPGLMEQNNFKIKTAIRVFMNGFVTAPVRWALIVSRAQCLLRPWAQQNGAGLRHCRCQHSLKLSVV